MLTGFWFGVGHSMGGPMIVVAGVVAWAVGLVVYGMISRTLKRWRARKG
jgi:hypothetical protein